MSLLSRQSDQPFVFESEPVLPDGYAPSWEKATGTIEPAMEAYEERHAFVARFEMPGVDSVDEIKVTVNERTLRVEAERRRELNAFNDAHGEFRYGTYARSVELPMGAETESTSADYANGVLTVRVSVDPNRIVAQRVQVRRADYR